MRAVFVVTVNNVMYEYECVLRSRPGLSDILTSIHVHREFDSARSDVLNSIEKLLKRLIDADDAICESLKGSKSLSGVTFYDNARISVREAYLHD